MDYVAHETGHRNTAVLHLGVAQKADGGVVRLLPELATSQVERVVVADHRVLLLGKLLEAIEVKHGGLHPLDDGGGRGAGEAGRHRRDREHGEI